MSPTYPNLCYSLLFGFPSEERVRLIPDARSEKLNPGMQRIVSTRPVTFINARPKHYGPSKFTEVLDDIMFSAAGIVMRQELADEIGKYETIGLQICNANIVDLSGQIHEGYTFLNFIDDFDCWSREDSEALEDDDDEDEDEDDEDLKYLNTDPVVVRFSLDPERIGEVPEANRRIFQLGGANPYPYFVHKSIVTLFRQTSATGAITIPVTNYYGGFEFEAPKAGEQYP